MPSPSSREQHYALLRARIRLAEVQGFDINSRNAGHAIVPYSVAKQQAMAEDTYVPPVPLSLCFFLASHLPSPGLLDCDASSASLHASSRSSLTPTPRSRQRGTVALACYPRAW